MATNKTLVHVSVIHCYNRRKEVEGSKRGEGETLAGTDTRGARLQQQPHKIQSSCQYQQKRDSHPELFSRALVYRDNGEGRSDSFPHTARYYIPSIKDVGPGGAGGKVATGRVYKVHTCVKVID